MKTPETKQLLKKALATIEELTASLSRVKDMLPLEHPAQNYACYDVEEICNDLAEATKAKP